MKLNKFVDIGRKYIDKCDGRNQHISLLVVRNKILSIGVNSYLKSSPFAKYHGYVYGRIHSELSAIKKFPWRENDIAKATLVNIRYAKANDGLLMSCPCLNCLKLIETFGIKKIYFSLPNGEFGEL